MQGLFIPQCNRVINRIIIAGALNLHCIKFILNPSTPNNSAASGARGEQERLMRRATLLSLTLGATLVMLKLVAWLFTDSLSMMSSLADSMLDVMASALNFVAVRYALQPPDAEHRFGHGKAEELATLAQSTFICGSGVFLIIVGIKRLFAPEHVHDGIFGIAVMVISTLLALSLMSYQRHVMKKTGSNLIAADAMHYFFDLLTNAGVIAAMVLGGLLGWDMADPIIGIAIAGSIIWGAILIGMKAFQNLMDHEFSDEERSRIKHIVQGHTDTLGLHDLRTRKSGIYRFVQFHLDLDGEISLRRAHEISDSVESAVREAFPNTEILIHQDPRHIGK